MARAKAQTTALQSATVSTISGMCFTRPHGGDDQPEGGERQQRDAHDQGSRLHKARIRKVAGRKAPGLYGAPFNEKAGDGTALKLRLRLRQGFPTLPTRLRL